MILILLGTIIGALFGFKAQEIVPKTESFQIQNILTIGPSAVIPKRSTRINDFWITYTKTKLIVKLNVTLQEPGQLLWPKKQHIFFYARIRRF